MLTRIKQFDLKGHCLKNTWKQNRWFSRSTSAFDNHDNFNQIFKWVFSPCTTTLTWSCPSFVSSICADTYNPSCITFFTNQVSILELDNPTDFSTFRCQSWFASIPAIMCRLFWWINECCLSFYILRLPIKSIFGSLKVLDLYSS